MAESSVAVFQKILALTQHELKTKRIVIRLDPWGKPQYKIDEASLKKSLEENGLQKDTFDEVFNAEIAPLIEAVLRGRVDKYVREQTGETKDAGARTQQEALIQERAGQITDIFITPDLKARYLVKVSTKQPQLRKLKWEVLEKRFEPTTAGPILEPYVSLTWETIRPERDFENLLFWFPFFPPGWMGRVECFAFDIDEVDLDDLIQTLQEVKSALVKTRRGGEK